MDCNDNNDCTVDVCEQDNTCSYEVATDGGTCDDGDHWTSNDTCSAGVCIGGALVGYDVTFNEYGWYRPPTLHNNIHLDNHDVGIEPFKDTYVSEGS